MKPEQILTAVTTLANELISKAYYIDAEGKKEFVYLYSDGWKFKFDNAKRRFGLCSYRNKTISLSKELTLLNYETKPKEVHDVVLHEISHALNYEMFGIKQDRHGPIWKQIARQIGCNATRCYDRNNVSTPEAKYTYECKHCNREMKRHKRITKELACGSCCKKFNGGKYSVDYILTLKK